VKPWIVGAYQNYVRHIRAKCSIHKEFYFAVDRKTIAQLGDGLETLEGTSLRTKKELR
jgi:hypothetical protein